MRSPINGILGMSDLLMGGRLDGEQQKRVQVIHSAAGDLLNLINDILDYSRIEAGKLQLESIEFDVHECIEGAVMLLAQQAQAKGLELTVIVQPDSRDPGCTKRRNHAAGAMRRAAACLRAGDCRE